jgi:syntaxin-binding protein 1
MASPDDHDSFRAATKRRILDEMLGRVSSSGGGEWKVLIVDPVTTPVVSASCGMSDLTNAGVSLVENLTQRREPQRHLDAVYFISPSSRSLELLCADFAEKDREKRLYSRAHVFFSSPIVPNHLATLKKCRGLVESLAALAELNLEYQTKDTHTFTTGQTGALRTFFGKHTDPSETAIAAELAAARLATLFASLREFPSIRYKAKGVDGSVGTSPACAVAQRLHRHMLSLRQKSSGAPGSLPRHGSTCDVLIVDRSFDPVAPVAREWTYEAMVFDLLPISPLGLYEYSVETNAGSQKKQAVVGENDALFVELRHEHIAFALRALAEKAKAISRRNASGGKVGLDSTTGSLKRAVESLPGLLEAQNKLSVHTSIAAAIDQKLRDYGLSDVGRLEERVIFGEATSKDVLALFDEYSAARGAARNDGNPFGAPPPPPLANFAASGKTETTETTRDLRPADKLRLLLLYAASHPEKFDDAERSRWSRATGLSLGDLAAVTCLENLGVKVSKPRSARGAAAANVGFRTTKSKRPVVHERRSEWDLHRFLPTVNHLVCQLDARMLPLAEFPELGGEGVGARAAAGAGSAVAPGSPARLAGPGSGGAPKTPGKSARTARTGTAGGGTWASKNRKPGGSSMGGEADFGSAAGGSSASLSGLDDGVSGGSSHHNAHERSGSAIPYRRLIVFVVGGVTRGEMREAHVLSRQLGREVLIGGTEIFTPEIFMGELARLGGGFSGALARDDVEVDLDDIVID